MRFRTLQAAPLMQLPVFLSLFFAPVFVPVELLAGWLQTIAHLNPVTLMLAAGRSLIAGQPAHIVGAFGAAFALIGLFSLWAVRGLRRAEAAGGWLYSGCMNVRTALFWLGTVTGIAYLVIGVLGAWWPGHWDDAAASDQIMGSPPRRGGAAVLAGLRIIDSSPRWGAILVAVGAVAGALVIFWTVIVIVVALTVAVLAVVYARRLAPPSTASDTRA